MIVESFNCNDMIALTPADAINWHSNNSGVQHGGDHDPQLSQHGVCMVTPGNPSLRFTQYHAPGCR